MEHLTKLQSAYIAGFLDGDGSIYIRLKPNKDYHFGFQIAPNIVFYQSNKNWLFLKKIKNIIGAGYLRQRNDGISEYIIGDTATMKSLLKQLIPYLILKKKQAQLFVRILKKKEQIKNQKDFVALAKMIDKLEALNYSKKRRITSQTVVDTFKQLYQTRV